MQLYLNTYGAYLHVKDALFEVRLPQEGGGHQRRHFAASKVTSIIMTTSAALSTDAVQLALQNNIDIVFADSSGFPLGRVWHSKLGSTTRIRKRQLEASIGPEGVRRTVAWLSAKLGNQIEFIKSLKKHRSRMGDFLDEKAARIENLQQSIRLQEEAPSVDAIAETLRGLEGTAGRLYFESLSRALPEEHRFPGRSFRPALDPFNAFLNYGYGVLYNRVEKALMIAGLDPYVGFLHRDDYNQKSMVFDYIEPYYIIQHLYCYAWLIEDNFQKPVRRGFLVYTRSRNKVVEVPVQEEDKAAVRAAAAICDIIGKNTFPRATKYKRRCLTCTYRNICIR